MIRQPTLSDVPAAEESPLGSIPNLEHGNASTYVSINNENDGFSEGFPMNPKQTKNLGTKRKMNSQEEALHLDKRKIKLMEERLMKKSQADEDEDMSLVIVLPSIKKTGRHSQIGIQNFWAA
jgi:hypothetical protein